ncbi:MAG: nucleotide sugar dehydrogenase [Nocardioides sp.]|nr:nucleotide sugar dehydrogenase [Nocardioides sp.]
MQPAPAPRRITVVGTGYVGLSLAVLLARHHRVVALDIDAERIAGLQAGRSPISDRELQELLARDDLDLRFTTDQATAYDGPQAPDFVIVATPTDYDVDTDSFDTSSVETVVREASGRCPDATLVVKSTVPVGFTAALSASLGTDRLVFSPEFLREGHAVFDNLHPTRIVVGQRSAAAQEFADILRATASVQPGAPAVPVLLTDSTEAEAIKLFANTYLALRVAYFNELDTFAATHGLDTRQIIEGVGLDPRVGEHYNNPSFGYGGYCLPKDTKQLRASYRDIPQNLVAAVVTANVTRKDFVADDIMRREPRVVGIHRLSMKAGADNYRSSSVLGVMRRLQERGVEVVVLEPTLTQDNFAGARVVHTLDELLAAADLIVANRMVAELEPHRDRVYTRDLFGGDD